MYCDQCGQPAPIGASACPHCGTSLDISTLDVPAVADRAPRPVPRPRAPEAVETGVVEPPGVRHPLAGHVAQGPLRAVWWRSMFGRNQLGVAAGVLAAWFNVPFVVLMGGIGVVFGGLAGTVNGTVAGVGVTKRIDALLTWVFPLPVTAEDLLPTAGAQVGGIIGGILGALNGGLKLAWMGFAWPWEALYRGDPTWPFAVLIGQLVSAAFVGLLYVGWRTVAEGGRRRLAGARRLSRREAAWLMPIMAEAGERLGLHALPRLMIDDRREPNAHAGIRSVVVNAGLLEQLNYDRQAIGAVIAHELVHWRDGDAISMTWARGVALPLFVLYELANRMLHVARWRPVQFTIRVLLWPVLVTVNYFVIPVQAAYWRRQEYRADAAAAAAGYAPGLRTALTYMRHSFDGSRSGWDAAVCATHPPNELRLEALEQAGRTYALREDHPLLKALPGHDRSSTVERGW